jgi:type VI secretion system protein
VVAGSLFDRLTKGKVGMLMKDDESIRLHLLRMLNTRQGAVQCLPDYGLPDLNDLSVSRAEVIRQCCISLSQSIEQYEPRLIDVEVHHIPLEDQFTMSFRVKAMRVADTGAHVPWHWSVSLEGGRVRGDA